MMIFSSDFTCTGQKLIGLLNTLDATFDFSEIKNIEVSDICDDSRQVTTGALFVARAGNDNHGEQYISNAIKGGAVAVLRQADEKTNNTNNTNNTNKTVINWISAAINKSIPEIVVSFSSAELSLLAVAFYKDPSKQMQVTGITGTNGKTSCAYILANLINSTQKCGFIGTIGIGEINTLAETKNTTLGIIDNQKVLAGMYGNGVKQVVMEISSHALVQHRIDGVDINCAVFTNLTHDHLDYHKTIENYGDAKLELFRLDTLNNAVVNLDDEFSTQVLKVISDNVNVITYGINNEAADLVAEIIKFELSSTLIKLTTKQENIEVKVPLLGKFNISNLLAVCGVLLTQGQSLVDIVKLIPGVQSVRGRMQCLGGVNDLPLVVIDYAHTPDALNNVLQTLRLHCNGKLICVFGCGGDRDTTKRAVMGEVVSLIADEIVITNDNPRTEEPSVIANEIASGIKDKSKTEIILDRKEAIQLTIEKARKSDVVLIAGKGHESYQIIDNIKYHFDDVKISLEVLNTVGIK